MEEQDYQPPSPQHPILLSHILTLFMGVILPAISITLEATTHICADTFFDPIPTAWHLGLVIFVPLAHLHVWFAIRRGNAERLTVAGLLNAVAIGISIFYSLVYIPVLPLAALTLLFIVGLLPLAPLLSLVAGLTMRYQLNQIASKAPKKSFAVTKAGMFAGLGITVAMIGLIELPVTLTRYGLQMASSQSPETRTKGIQFLRSFGSEEYLRRSCYHSTGWATDLIGYVFSLQNPVTVDEARKIYYRVTGETYDTSPPPLQNRGTMTRLNDFDFDSDQGGVKIGGKLKGLSLASSKLDASADPEGGAGYMQWTLVFANDSPQQREARAEVQLPPGAVVSRLTLWVNGEEREAAFAGRSQVRQAYEQVVRQRRDPVLVTTAGRDRILVQCFPVPSQGEMKIRVGITVPLLLEDRAMAVLLLPHFNDRNFRIPDDVKHSVWIESKHEMGTKNTDLFFEHPTASVYALRGQLKDEELAKPKSSIQLVRPYHVSDVWSRNPFESEGSFIWQSIEERAPAHLNRIVLVVDTSAATEAWARDIFAAIRSVSPEFDLKLVLADDRLSETGALQDSIASGLWDISEKFRNVKFAGGADNVPALIKAWELAAEKPGNNAIVWIHNPQRLLFTSVEELRQRWERRPYGPQLYSVQIIAGPDEIDKKLDGINEVRSVVQTGNLRSDLEALFARLTGRVKTLEFVRKREKLDSVPSEAVETSAHLARLWANDEVARILSARDESLNEAATTLAVRYQLVTPVSGAVVLETAEQYRAAGLKPVEPGTVPTIPEPEIVALLGVLAAIFVSWFIQLKLCRKRRYRL